MAEQRLCLPVSVAGLVARFGGTVLGRGAASRRITGLAALAAATATDLAFFSNPKYRTMLRHSEAGVVVLAERDAALRKGARIVVSGDPRTWFGRVVNELGHGRAFPAGVHPSATVSPTVRLGRGVHVGAGAVIGAGATIGAGTCVLAHAVVTEGCVVGRDCLLHEGCVIGAEGFGFFPDGTRSKRIRHLGVVVLGDRVEIGANTCVDRGLLGDTKVGRDTKIDNLVQVAHNVVIGENCTVCGCVAIAGSTVIGDRCVIGGDVAISGHLSIVGGVSLMAGTRVLKSILTAGIYGGVLPHFPLDNLRLLWRQLLKMGNKRDG